MNPRCTEGQSSKEVDSELTSLEFPSMEKLKWSGTGGSICVTAVVGIRCVHYIEEKDCTAKFATGGI